MSSYQIRVNRWETSRVYLANRKQSPNQLASTRWIRESIDPHSTNITHSRWMAYAAAGAATAFAGHNSAEADIHYSIAREAFPERHDKTVAFPLDQPGDSFQFKMDWRSSVQGGIALFHISAPVSASWRGSSWMHLYHHVSKLNFRDKVSAGSFQNYFFVYGSLFATHGGGSSQWQEPGHGFVGFKFNNGARTQYGWRNLALSSMPFE